MSEEEQAICALMDEASTILSRHNGGYKTEQQIMMCHLILHYRSCSSLLPHIDVFGQEHEHKEPSEDLSVDYPSM